MEIFSPGDGVNYPTVGSVVTVHYTGYVSIYLTFIIMSLYIFDCGVCVREADINS
jgi:hypothetical protein